MASNVSTLVHNLTGGMGVARFDDEIREKQAHKFERAFDYLEVNQLYSLSKLESLLKSDAAPVACIDIFHSGHLLRLADMQRKSGRSYFEVALDSFRQGSTIRVRDLEQSDAQLNSWVGELRRQFAAQVQMNLYLTPPATSGFPPHFDTTDVFIVQCAGKKEWRIFHQYANRVELPTMEINWDPDVFKPSAGGESMMLEAGDVLYLPRGVMHEARCDERESMHLTISLAPLTFGDLLTKALRAACETEVEFRRRVPWSVNAEENRLEDLKRRVALCIEKFAERIDVEAVLTAERRRLDGRTGGTCNGELESAVASLLGVGEPSR